jgi:hypothetical protein
VDVKRDQVRDRNLPVATNHSNRIGSQAKSVCDHAVIQAFLSPDRIYGVIQKQIVAIFHAFIKLDFDHFRKTDGISDQRH